MKEGNIILTSMPQADGNSKLRPALILRVMPPFNDFLICGISTQTTQMVSGFDELIRDDDPDFNISGLRQASLIRLGFLAVLPLKNIAGAIGHISKSRHTRLLQNLCLHLTKNLNS